MGRRYNSMTRPCFKCGEDLVVNGKLGLMECVSGKHIEPINLNRPQWWNECPKCKQKGLNDADQEARLQKLEIVEIDGQKVKKPVFTKIGEKDAIVVFEEQAAKPITCKACGNIFTKN
jgi:hypothetical protein